MADSYITKKVIAEGLIKLTAGKSFDKITVSDIAGASGINRQTFYYHFQDKYELLDWIYYNYTFKPLIEDISFENWEKKFLNLLVQMKENQGFYMNTIKCSVNYFEEYLFKILVTLFGAAIESLDVENRLSKGDRLMFARFFSHGLCGTVIDWALEGMKESVEEMERHITYLAQSAEKAAYRHYIEEGVNS